MNLDGTHEQIIMDKELDDEGYQTNQILKIETNINENHSSETRKLETFRVIYARDWKT